MPAKHGGQTVKIKRVVGKTVRAINSLLSKLHKISSTEKSFVNNFYRTDAILRCTFALETYVSEWLQSTGGKIQMVHLHEGHPQDGAQSEIDHSDFENLLRRIFDFKMKNYS